MDEGSPLLSLCVNACYSPDPFVAVKAVTILARVVCYWYEEKNYLNVKLNHSSVKLFYFT